MKSIIQKIFTALLISLGIATSAYALSLDEAKQKGFVGEKPDGYLGIRENSPDVAALANDVNNKRREKYQQVASKSGTSLKNVEVLAGEKAIQATPKGQWVVSANGSWVTK